MIPALAVPVTEPPLAESVVPPDFSLCKGGPLYDLGQRLRLRESVSLIRLGIGLRAPDMDPSRGVGRRRRCDQSAVRPSLSCRAWAHTSGFCWQSRSSSRPKRCSTPGCRRSFGGFSKCSWCCHATSRGWRRAVRQAIRARNSRADGSAAPDPDDRDDLGWIADRPAARRVDVANESGWRAHAGRLVVQPGEHSGIPVPVLALVLASGDLDAPACGASPGWTCN